jgi:hypothetical protein
MAENMAMRFNESTQCVQNREGVQIHPRGFGETSGVSVVNPDDAVKYKLFYTMFQSLESLGYESGKDLRTATYDWRKWGTLQRSNSILSRKHIT